MRSLRREAKTGKGAVALERRPQLATALAAARKAKYAVLVSLGRLSRDVVAPLGSRLPDHTAPLSRPISALRNAAMRKPGACVSAQMGTCLACWLSHYLCGADTIGEWASSSSPETNSIADMI